jgi:ketosteroid isomerase-like protein
MMVSQQTRLQVLDVMDRFALHCSRKEVEEASSLVHPEFFGFFREGERVDGRESFSVHLDGILARCDEVRISFEDLEIGAEGTIVWITGTCRAQCTRNNERTEHTSRFSTVLRGTGHAWLFAMFHFSPSGPLF